MKQITIKHKTFGENVVSFDDADESLVSQFNWTLHRVHRTLYCVHRRMTKGVEYRVYMHRLLMGNPEGCLVDHKDGNGLNNTRNNLRKCDRTDNARNSRLYSRNSTGFKGVTRHNDKFRASIVVNGKRKHLGVFDDAKMAAETYNSHAVRCFGEFAKPNIL